MSWAAGDWICGRCQHSNFKRRDTCHLCGYPKCGGPDPSTFSCTTTPVVKAGDWYCTNINCGVHNFASRSSCYVCGELKNYNAGVVTYGAPDHASAYPPGWKPGDWICNSVACGGHNYASKKECYRCGTPRDYGSGYE